MKTKQSYNISLFNVSFNRPKGYLGFLRSGQKRHYSPLTPLSLGREGLMFLLKWASASLELENDLVSPLKVIRSVAGCLIP